MKKLFYSLLTFGLMIMMFSACETQEDIVKESGNKINTETVSFETLFSKIQSKKMNINGKNLFQQKNTGNLNRGEADFIKDIDTTTIERIEIAGKESYTLRVITESDTENVFYNMIVYEIDNIFYTDYVKYEGIDNTQEGAEKLINSIKTSVDENGVEISDANPSSSNKDNCSSFAPIWQCSYGNAHSPDEGHTPVCMADTWFVIGFTEISVPCSGEGHSNEPNHPPVESPGSPSGYPTGNQQNGGSGGGTGSNNTNTTGGVYGNGGLDGTGIYSTPIIPKKTIKDVKIQFRASLTTAQKAWWDLHVNEAGTIAQYLFENLYTLVEEGEQTHEEFAKEIIDLARVEPNQADVNALINISVLFDSSDIFKDEFELSLDPFVDINIAGLQSGDPNVNLLSIKVYMNYRKLRQLNPNWSRAKCLWYATKEIIHISLDVFGVIPVGGEIADLVNGALYAIEGDGLNASLSMVSAIPLVGYGSLSTKYSLKIINQVNDINSKVKLVWKVTANGVSFGSRSQLRKVLGLAVGDLRQAHHIIPWNKQSKEIVQKAAESGNAFHMNEALNGIPLNTSVHNGSHSAYDNIIEQKFINFRNNNPNATPQECYDFLVNLINNIRTWILNNPTSHINNLVLP